MCVVVVVTLIPSRSLYLVPPSVSISTYHPTPYATNVRGHRLNLPKVYNEIQWTPKSQQSGVYYNASSRASCPTNVPFVIDDRTQRDDVTSDTHPHLHAEVSEPEAAVCRPPRHGAEDVLRHRYHLRQNRAAEPPDRVDISRPTKQKNAGTPQTCCSFALPFFLLPVA